MRTQTKKLLFDILGAGREIAAFNTGGTLASYSASAMQRAATERMFEIMGEAMTRLRESDPEVLAMITDGAGIIGFRNRLIHGYDAVDDEIVWRIIQEKAPLLIREVRALLENAGETFDEL
jgi:uncharacterized protein with HEPN domain